MHNFFYQKKHIYLSQKNTSTNITENTFIETANELTLRKSLNTPKSYSIFSLKFGLT